MRILPSRYSDQSGFFRRKDDLPMEMLSIHFLDALVENDDSIPIHHSRKKIEKTILSITLIRSILLCRTSRLMWVSGHLFSCFASVCCASSRLLTICKFSIRRTVPMCQLTGSMHAARKLLRPANDRTWLSSSSHPVFNYKTELLLWGPCLYGGVDVQSRILETTSAFVGRK